MTRSPFDLLRSTIAVKEGPVSERLASVAEIERGHGHVLGEFVVHPGRWLLWIDADPTLRPTKPHQRGRLLWFAALEDGRSVIAEVTSNQHLDESCRLDHTQEDLLRRSGWSEPDDRNTTNWFLELDLADGLDQFDHLTKTVLRDVFGLRFFDRVLVGFQRRYVA
jgi:hypothetical protein